MNPGRGMQTLLHVGSDTVVQTWIVLIEQIYGNRHSSPASLSQTVEELGPSR